jgi:hypothetical protein
MKSIFSFIKMSHNMTCSVWKKQPLGFIHCVPHISYDYITFVKTFFYKFSCFAFLRVKQHILAGNFLWMFTLKIFMPRNECKAHAYAVLLHVNNSFSLGQSFQSFVIHVCIISPMCNKQFLHFLRVPVFVLLPAEYSAPALPVLWIGASPFIVNMGDLLSTDLIY